MQHNELIDERTGWLWMIIGLCAIAAAIYEYCDWRSFKEQAQKDGFVK